MWQRFFGMALAGAVLLSTQHAGSPAAVSLAAIQRAVPLTTPEAALREPFAVAVAGNGDYFVADAGHNRVAHFDSKGNFLGSIGQPASTIPQPAKGELNSPTGVALDGKGNLLVADLGNGRVAEFTLNGAYIGQIGSYGFDAGEFLGPSAVAVGADGRVYVLDTGGGKVSVFSAQGKYMTRWGGYGSGIGEFDGPSGLALDARGNVYVSDTNNNRVQEFSADGTYLAQWGSFGKDNGDFRYPTGLAIDADGNIWVDDAGNSRVVEIQHPATYQGSFTLDGVTGASGIAVDGLTAYIVDTAGERVVAYSLSGTPGATIGKGGHGTGQISNPMGAATDAQGNVYVADTNNNRIQKLSPSGALLASYGKQGRDHQGSSPRFLGPQAVAVDASGNIYVADTFNNRIQKLDSGGNYLWEQQIGGQPRGIAVDVQGNVYVTSYYNDRVEKLNSSGKLLTLWGGRGRTNGLFLGPSAIAVDKAGRVYVGDAGNGRVAIFGELADGTYGYSGQFGGTGTGDGQFSALAGIGVAADDTVYVVDQRSSNGPSRVEKFNPFGAQFTGWGSDQLQSLAGLALDGSGHVVVVDGLGNQVDVYTSRGDLVRQLP